MTVSPLSLPGPIRMSDVEVAAEKKEVAITLEVQADAPAREYTLSVAGQTQVPYSKDVQAKQKPNTLVTQPSRLLILVLKSKAE